jgi:hypothetical protein
MGSAKQNGVFIWNKYKSWRGTILRLLDDLIDESVFAELKRNPPRYFVGDNLGWLDGAIERAKGIIQPDIRTTLSERLSHHYQFIRAFHGCRTDSIRPYREHGVRPSDPSALYQIALSLFSDKGRIDAAMKDIGVWYPDYNRGKAFFCLQMEELVEQCGHYLLYGSEYLLCIANRVGEPEVLRRRGRATAIECNVPIGDVSPDDIRELAGDILREIFERYCDRTYQAEILSFGFAITTILAPKNIVGFHFPTGIPNPHNYQMRED